MKILLSDRYMKIIFPIFLFAIFFISSCNLFLSLPHGRENVDDSKAQITAFTALPSGDDSIVTMWNWKNSLNVGDEEEIKEIHIQHSIFGYPENYNPILGETFTDSTTWQHEWKDLIPGITHYFSLFSKSSDGDGGDIWFAPIKAKISLTGKVKSTIESLTYSWTVNTSYSVNGGILTGSLDTSNVMVIELGLPEDMKIVSAVINPALVYGIETNSVDTFKIYPLTRPFNEVDGYIAWNQVADNFDTNIEYLVNDSAGIITSGTNITLNDFPIDITTPVRMALATGSKQLVLRMDTIGITVNNIVWNDFLVIEYYD